MRAQSLNPPEPALAAGPEERFAEPWQAEAFACAIQLSRQGLYTWPEWVEVFSAEIKAHPQQAGETSNSAYYRQWLAALERLLRLKGVTSETEIDRRAENWRRAYLNTPHGLAVQLHHAWDPPASARPSHETAPEPGRERPRRAAPAPITVSPSAEVRDASQTPARG